MTTESRGRDAPNGSQWIEWKGGECPVAGDVMVTVRIGSLGESSLPYRADGFSWKHYGSEADIIAYRVCAPLETGAPTITGVDMAAPGSDRAVEFCPQTGEVFAHPPASPAAAPRDILIADLMATRVSVQQPTPRTDAMEAGIDARHSARGFYMPEDVVDLLVLARTLEREVAELRGKLAEARDEQAVTAANFRTYRKRAKAAEFALATAKKDERAQALEDALGMLIQADTLEAGMSHIQRALFALGEEA